MADSLRDQLIKAGLATQEQADRLDQPKHRKPREGKAQANSKRQKARRSRSHRDDHKSGATIPSAEMQKKSQNAPASAGSALPEKRRIKAKIKAMIEAASVKDFAGELSFNFVVGERIRQIFVTESARKSIVSGELAITRLNRETHLIPPEVASRVKALNPDWLIVLNGEASGDSEPATDPENPYDQYTVPDDLHW